MPLRPVRTVRRLSRPAVALVLVVAQVASAFGFPLVRPRAAGVSACGCVTPCGQDLANCCCKGGAKPAPVTKGCGRCGGEAGACCHTRAPVEPKPAKCAKCRTTAPTTPTQSPAATLDESSTTVTWVAGFKARQCRGEGPLGLLAELPSVPPVVAPRTISIPAPVGVILVADQFSASHFAAPLDPPPRCG